MRPVLGSGFERRTTLIRVLLGLTQPTAGSVRLLGLPMPAGRVEALARVGAIVEEPRFHPFLTGRENLAIVAAARERAADGRIDAALARVGLAARADDRVAGYSLGMRQRLGVARCLLADPELLILDEPMNGLDPAGMEEFREMIGELVGEGRTVVLGVLAILHAANPANHGPAGGVAHLATGIGVLAGLAAVAATIVGATAGAGDLGDGVFRELVVTGRPRQALFNARIPGGAMFLLPFVAVAFALTAVASLAFAGSLAAPSARLLAESGGWLLLNVDFAYALALGLASLVGSRSTTIGVLLAWWLAVSPLLVAISFLGAARDVLPSVALDRFIPNGLAGVLRPDNAPSMSVAAAAATLLVWTVVALAVGSWRTRTRDA